MEAQENAITDALVTRREELHLQSDTPRSDGYSRYKLALQRFLAVSKRRRHHFQALQRAPATEENGDQKEHGGQDDGEKQPASATQRMCILSENDEPWNVFTSSDSPSFTQHRSSSSLAFLTSLRMKRLVFEWSDLHFPPLHSTCASGDRSLVRRLLLQSQSSDPSQSCSLARDASGRIPLHHAAVREQLKILTLLLSQPDARLQVHVRDNSGYSAVHYVLFKLKALAHRRYPQCHPAHRAALHMRRVSKRYRRLWRAADEMLRLVSSPVWLSDCGEDASSNPTEDLDFSLRALDWRCRGDAWDATRSGDLERLRFLFEVYYNRTQAKDCPVVLGELRRSLLHEACDQQHLPVLYYLVTHQYQQQHCRVANKHLKDASGCTALHYAAMRGFLEGCVVLLEDQQQESQDTDGDTEVLCLAVDTRGRTALHWSLLANQAQSKEASVVKYLVTKCVSALHVSDGDGFTPLHMAIWRGDLEIVELFVRLGANVNIVGSCRGEAAGVGDMGYSAEAAKITASWAPCGARFHCQSRKPSKLKDHDEGTGGCGDGDAVACREMKLLAGPQDEVQEECPASAVLEAKCGSGKQNSPSNPQEDEKSAEGSVDENSVVMDTFKFWLRTSNKKKTRSDNKRVSAEHAVLQGQGVRPAKPRVKENQRTQQREGEQDDSSARGCRKYGGICSECSDHNDATEDASSGAASHSTSGVMSPLVLAIRVCGPARGRDRVAIIEVLLLAGADPNEDVSDGGGEMESSSRSPLIEALYVARSACPQIVSLLRTYGAKRFCVKQLERFCLSSMTSGGATAAGATAEVDAALLGLVDILGLRNLETEAASPLLSAFFVARCFNSLNRLLHSLSCRYRAAADEDDDNQVEPPPFSVWRSIQSELFEAHAKATTAVELSLRLDREHLWFLCECLKRSQQLRDSSQESCSHDDAELKELLGLCLDRCLTTWRHQAKVKPVDEHERFERQQIVVKCMKLIRSAPNHHRDPHAGRTGHPAQWLEYCIALGFFDCALRLLIIQLAESPRSAVSMDHLLKVYGDEELTNRHHHLLGFPSSHEDFLIAMVEKCVAAMEWAVAVQPDTSADTDPHGPPIVRMSSESFVRACAYNLPPELVRKIWSLARRFSNNSECCVKAAVGNGLRRVGGKTLVEWLVRHRRRDLIQFLLQDGAATRASSVLLWRDCVSAVVTAVSTGSETDQHELLSWLLSLYPPLPAGDAADIDGEELKMVEWLTLHRAVRCDSPLLFMTIVEPLWAQLLSASSSGPEDVVQGSETSEQEPSTSSSEQQVSRDRKSTTAAPPLPLKSLFSRLRRIRFFHQVAQWNALKLATYLMNERFSKPPSSHRDRTVITTLQWRDVLLGLRGDEEEEEQTVAEASSPLAICCSLGRVQLAQLFLKSTGSPTDTSESPPELQELHSNGLFRSITSLNAQVHAPGLSCDRHGKAFRTIERLEVFQSVDQWQVAAKFNLVTHLQALSLHRVPVSTVCDPLQGTPSLLLLAITSGSLQALQWLLTNHFDSNTTSFNDPTVVEMLYEAASKHPSDLYAVMTLLLLDHIPYNGRLSGDGNTVTLLHRCVCFSNPQLVRKAVDRVLSIPGSSVNVLDAFGNPPVVYACASGNLSSLCYLVSCKNARLEAEYEGQASFYYALQLLPSFAWRFVMESLLMTDKCGRRYLHCDGGETEPNDGNCASSCGCKGFEGGASPGDTERVPSDDGEAPLVLCGFCGHEAERHRKIPFPPWFMDQYETYLDKTPDATARTLCQEHDSEGDSEGEERERKLEGPSVNEVTLEDQRGRLNVAALTAITVHNFAALVEEYGLSVDCASPREAPEILLAPSSETGGLQTEENSEAASVPNDESCWPMFPLNVLGGQAITEPEAQRRSGSVGSGGSRKL